MLRVKALNKLFACIFPALLVLTLSLNTLAQEKYICKNGHIYFISHTDLLDIEADNHVVSSLINTQNGEMAFLVYMNQFKFKLPLAEEHFNENYVETHLYPKAAFKGKIINFSDINFSKDGTYTVYVEGDLNIHGVTKKIKEKASLEISGKKVKGTARMSIAIKDYNITVPNLVMNKVAEIIDVKIEMNYEPFVK